MMLGSRRKGRPRKLWTEEFEMTIKAMTTQPSNDSELQLYRVLQRANLLSYYDTFICQGGDDVQQLCEAGEDEFLEIMALVGMASKPLHVRRLQKALQEWVNNPAMFQTPLVPNMSPLGPGRPVNLAQQSPLRTSPPSLPMLSYSNSHSPGHKDVPSPLHHQQSQLHHQPPTPAPSQSQQQQPSPIPPPPSMPSQQQVSVNEAAAQICKHIPSLLTRRDELFPLARQVVRDSGYQYSKGHSRSQQNASKHYEDELACKRQRLDTSPGTGNNSTGDRGIPGGGNSSSNSGGSSGSNEKTPLEDEKKKRQERLDMIVEQLKVLGSQQEELKSRLQQARDMQNYAATGHVQAQLDQLATQQMTLINEQSKLTKEIRRIERYYGKGCGGGRMSACSEVEKLDNDDTDSQFSAYSNASSPTINQDSPSQDSEKNPGPKKSSVQITRQLVQETLMDEGLRVVKELANQIREEQQQQQQQQQQLQQQQHQPLQHQQHPVPPPPPPPPPRMDGPRPRGRPPKIERDYTVSTLTAPSMPPMPPTSCMNMGPPPNRPLNGPVAEGNHNQESGILPLTNGTNGHQMACPTGNTMDQVVALENSVKMVQENSLNALLAFSQKGLIKQEPNSPSMGGFKLD